MPTGIIMIAASTKEPFALDMPKDVMGVVCMSAICPYSRTRKSMGGRPFASQNMTVERTGLLSR